MDSYWSKSSPNVPLVWSASSLGCLSSCPRKFQYRYVEGWTQGESSLDLDFGTYFHTALELYWIDRLAGLSHEDSMDDAVWVGMLCAPALPEPTRPKQRGKTPMGLITCIVWYLDQWSQYDTPDEILSTVDGTPGIELDFTFLLPIKNSDGELYRIRGYLDSLRNFALSYTAWDYKTTAGEITEWYLKKFEIDLQNAIYTIAARVLTEQKFSQFMADIVGIRFLSRTEEYVVDLNRHIVTLTEGELDEYVSDIVALIHDAERYAESGHYPKRTDACGFCEFQGICSKDPSVREAFLKTDFEKNRRTIVEDRI